jgi:hypothetical protein
MGPLALALVVSACSAAPVPETPVIPPVEVAVPVVIPAPPPPSWFANVASYPVGEPPALEPFAAFNENGRVRYDCAALGFTPSHGSAAADSPLTRGEALLHAHARAAEGAATFPLDELAAARGVLADLAAQGRGSLTMEQRIEAQNLAYRMAIALAASAPEAAPEAIEVVLTLAPPPASFAALPAEHDVEIAALLGGDIVERRTERCGEGALMHEYSSRGAHAFRPVRQGDRRALLAYLVGFDSEGGAHVTPYLAHAELRVGLEHGGPACVIERTPALSGPAQLHAVAFEELPETSFIRPSGDDQVNCETCHAHAVRAFDVSDAGEAADLRAARHALLEPMAEDHLAQLVAQWTESSHQVTLAP